MRFGAILMLAALLCGCASKPTAGRTVTIPTPPVEYVK